jgi:hypothetical protein
MTKAILVDMLRRTVRMVNSPDTVDSITNLRKMGSNRLREMDLSKPVSLAVLRRALQTVLQLKRGLLTGLRNHYHQMHYHLIQHPFVLA